MTLDYLKKRKTADWRAKEVVGIKDLKKVTHVHAEYLDGGKKTELNLIRNEKGWMSEGADKLPLDEKGVEAFLADIKSIRATEIVGDEADKEAGKFGFDHPYAK